MHSLMRQLNQKSRLFWLKLPNITTIFKKRSKNQKENYRPVSILPTISKIFENILNKQLSIYFENIYFFNFNVVLEGLEEKEAVEKKISLFKRALLTDL